MVEMGAVFLPISRSSNYRLQQSRVEVDRLAPLVRQSVSEATLDLSVSLVISVLTNMTTVSEFAYLVRINHLIRFTMPMQSRLPLVTTSALKDSNK